MARTLEDFDFASAHGNAKYPWADWSNGETWQIERGQDFDCDVDVMRGQIIVRARKDGRRVETRVVREPGGSDQVVFRFLGPVAPDQAVEAQSA